MAISCGVKCARSILLTFNLVFWLSGCAMLMLGVWLIVEPGPGRLLSAVSSPHTPPAIQFPIAYALVSIGGIILLVGFIGCCGTLQESRCLIAVYFVLLVVILAAELAVAVAALVFREHTLADMETRLVSSLHAKYGQQDHKEFSLSIDFLQYKYNCCGIHGDEDYLKSNWLNTTLQNDKIKSVPPTCCILQNENVSNPAGSPISVVSRVFYGYVEENWQNPQPKSEAACQDSNVNNFEQARHRQGCYSFIEEEFKKTSLVIIIAGLSTGALEILGMIFSICLCRNITDDI